MGLSHSPRIVTGDIALFVDFANPASLKGNTLSDMSSNRFTVTLTNPTANTLTIQNGHAVFSPPDESNTATFYTISNTYFNNIVNSMTVECCVYISVSGTGGTRIVSPRTSETTSPLGFGLSFTGITIETNTNTGWKTSSYNGSEFGQNKWVHITQTTSTAEDSTKTYINGVLKNTMSLANSTPNGGNGFTIGRGFYGGIRNANGAVSFLKVYNRALSAAEIQQNFNALRGRFNI